MKNSIILCVALVASIFMSCRQLGDDENQEKVVKITPMFSAKVQQYSYLSSFNEGYAAVGRETIDSTGNYKFVYTYIDTEGNEIFQCQYEDAKGFSEGLAAVKKDGKYGFVNVQGDIVIPFDYSEANCFGDGLANVCKDGRYCYINKDGIEVISIPTDETIETILTPFSEEIAFVIKPKGWDCFGYYAIDKVGKKLFEGTIGGWCAEEGGRFNVDYMPIFKNMEVYIPAEDYDTYDVYNKHGQKLRTEKGRAKNNENYEITTQIDTIGVSLIYRYGLNEIGKDLTDITPRSSIPAIYGEIHDVKNGVALVCLYQYYEDPDTYSDLCGEGGYVENNYYGYIDLEGNDTFLPKVKDRCKQSLDKAKSKYADYNDVRNNPTWLNGTWWDEHLTYRIFVDEKCITYTPCYQSVYEEYYTISDGRIIIEGDDAEKILDYEREIIIIDGIEWIKYSDSTTIDSLEGTNMAIDNDSNSCSDENLSWLDGNWRYKTTFYGRTQEVRVGISGNTIVVVMNGEHYYTGNFSIDSNTLRYNSQNGSSDYLIIDRTNKYLMVDERTRMERF